MTAPYFGLQNALVSSIVLLCLSRFGECYITLLGAKLTCCYQLRNSNAVFYASKPHRSKGGKKVSELKNGP